MESWKWQHWHLSSIAEAGITNIMGWLLTTSIQVMKHRASLWAEGWKHIQGTSKTLSLVPKGTDGEWPWCLGAWTHHDLCWDRCAEELSSSPAAPEMPFPEEGCFLVGSLGAYLVSNSWEKDIFLKKKKVKNIRLWPLAQTRLLIWKSCLLLPDVIYCYATYDLNLGHLLSSFQGCR